MLLDGWDMRFGNNLSWPFFVDHNTSCTDPRFMMARHQCPCALYDFYEPERPVEIPVRYQGRSKAMPTRGLHQQGSGVDAGYNSWNNHHPGTNFQKHRQPFETTAPKSRPFPRKCGNNWDIPIQFVGRNNVRPASHRSPQNQSPDGHQQNQTRGPVSIDAVHGVNGPETFTSPTSTSTSLRPTSGIPDSPCSSRRQNFSLDESPQPSNQQQSDNHPTEAPTPAPNNPEFGQPSPKAPTPAPNNPEFGQPSQQVPSYSQQQDGTPSQPLHSDKSLEDKAYEMINAIMSEVKGFEEQVNSFKGVKNDKEYRYLEEMLTRSLLKLDNIESGSNETVRQARKQVVRYIEATINMLELKALASEARSGPGSSVESNQNSNVVSQADSSSESVASSHEQSNEDLQEHINGSSDDAGKVEEMSVDTVDQELC